MKKKGCVYFFKHVGLSPVKIGYSNNESPLSRFEQFQTYAPYGTELVGFFITEDAKKIETKLHQKYAAKRLKGEWFEIPIEDVNYEINFHRKIEEVNQRSNFELHFSRYINKEEEGRKKEIILENDTFKFTRDEEYFNRRILNQRQISDLMGEDYIYHFKKSNKIKYKNHKIDDVQKKGYLLYFKQNNANKL